MNDQAVGGSHGHPTGITGGRQPGLEAQVERLKEQNRYLLVTMILMITKAINESLENSYSE